MDGRTRVVLHDLYPSKEALEAGSGSTEAMPESLAQLDDLLATTTAGDLGQASKRDANPSTASAIALTNAA
jgi:hypothetical protein